MSDETRPARSIVRYEVPVDDRWHTIELSGAVYDLGIPATDVVEFRALQSGGPAIARDFRVYGAGHTITEGYTCRGTAAAPGGQPVWHLVERAHG